MRETERKRLCVCVCVCVSGCVCVDVGVSSSLNHSPYTCMTFPFLYFPNEAATASDHRRHTITSDSPPSAPSSSLGRARSVCLTTATKGNFINVNGCIYLYVWMYRCLHKSERKLCIQSVTVEQPPFRAWLQLLIGPYPRER